MDTAKKLCKQQYFDQEQIFLAEGSLERRKNIEKGRRIASEPEQEFYICMVQNMTLILLKLKRSEVEKTPNK